MQGEGFFFFYVFILAFAFLPPFLSAFGEIATLRNTRKNGMGVEAKSV